MRAALATWRAAAAEVWTNRGSFWSQLVAMTVNDLAWVAFWTLFFHRVGTLRGWDISRVLLLEAALTAAGGLALGPFGNARRLGALAADGGLDAVLALPAPPLVQLLVRRVDAVHLGDVVFGVVLFAVAGHPTPARVALFAAVAVAGTVTLLGFLVATGSLSLFVGRGEPGELGFHAMLLLAAYPADVFSGLPRLLVFTAIPAAFVSTVPATLLDTFDPSMAVALAAAAVLSAAAGWAVFTLGLRRYTSGSAWTRS